MAHDIRRLVVGVAVLAAIGLDGPRPSFAQAAGTAFTYQGRLSDNGTAVTSQNGFTTFLKDRGFVSLTFKTTF